MTELCIAFLTLLNQMLIWVSDSTARKKRCALGSTRKGRSPLRSGQRSLRGQPLRKYITIRCSDPNHCDTGADRLPPAASMHQNRTTLTHGLGARSVRDHLGCIRCGFGWSESKFRFIWLLRSIMFT